MDLYPIKLTPSKGTPVAAIVVFSVVGLLANLLLLFVTAAAVGLGLRVGLGL